MRRMDQRLLAPAHALRRHKESDHNYWPKETHLRLGINPSELPVKEWRVLLGYTD